MTSETTPESDGRVTLAEAGVSMALLAGLTLIMFRSVLFTSVPLVLSNGGNDLFMVYHHWRAFGFEQLKQGNFALWDPCIFSGTPFFAGSQEALLYPLNALFLVLPLHHAINWCIALHVFLGGAFTFAWAAQRGFRVQACLLSGVMFMFCGANFFHIYAGYLSFVCAVVWAPLLFLAVDGLFQKPSVGWSLLGMFAVAMQILSGNPQAVFYTGVAAAVYCVLRAFQARPWRPFLLSCAAIPFGAAALSAVQLFASLQEWRELLRHAGVPYDFAASFSFPPENLVTLLAPNFFGDIQNLAYWGRDYLWEMSLFVSVTGVLLALVAGLWSPPRARRFGFVMVFVLFLLALGGHTPLFRFLYHWVPGFNKFRGNSKFIFLASLFLALLAGTGLDALIRGRRVPAWFLAVLGVAGAGLLGFGTIERPLDPGSSAGLWWRALILRINGLGESYLPPAFVDRPVFVLGAGQMAARGLLLAGATVLGLALLLWLLRKDSRVSWLFAAFALVELFLFAGQTLDHFDLRLAVNPAERAFLAAHPGDYRIMNQQFPNTALSLGAQDVWGYEPGIVSRYAELIAVTQGIDPDQAVSLTTLPGPLSSKSPLFDMLRKRFEFATVNDQFIVSESTNYLPHVLLVQRFRVLTNRAAILSALTNAAFNPRAEVILETAPDPAPVPSAAPGSVRLVHWSSDELTIEADVPSPAILLVPDVYAKGWLARPLPGSVQSRYRVQPANWCLRAIPLTAGHHSLRLEYLPLGFRIGRWISILSLLSFLAAVAFAARRIFHREALREARASFGSGALRPLLAFAVAMLAVTFALSLWQGRSAGEEQPPGQPAANPAALDDTITHLQEILRADPNRAGTHQDLALALLRKGKSDDALVQFNEAVRLDPKLADAHAHLVSLLLQKGMVAEAVVHGEAAIANQPDNPYHLNNLAWILATCPQPSLRDGARAVQLSQRADQLARGGNPSILETLAAAYAEAGRFPDAIATAQRALEMANAHGDATEAHSLQTELRLYQAGTPFRDSYPTNTAPAPP